MPNVGRPSRDCHLCRQRRVKCDLARPGCQRCAKYGRDCPGYRDQQELVFRTVNPSTTSTKQKKQQQRNKHLAPDETDREKASDAASPASTSSDSSCASSDETEWVVRTFEAATPGKGAGNQHDPSNWASAWALGPSLSQHWTSQSVPIVLTIYSSLEFLRDVLRENSGDGPLIWATHLFSRTYVTNIRQPTALSNESATESAQEIGTYMGKTLSAVGTALQTREGAFRDDIIGAVWMLCNYEIIVGSIGRMETDSPWHAHAAGLWSILKTRGKEALHTERGRNIFWPTYSLVQLDAIISNHECPPEGEDWLELLKHYSEGFMGYHIAIFLTRVSHFQTRALNIVLDRDQAALVKAYNFLLLVINMSTHDPTSPIPLEILYKHREYCLTRVRDSAWKILNATPDLVAKLVRNKYSVFDSLFQALKLVWPLTAVRLIPSTLPHQKAQAAKHLLIIGRHLGVRQATRSYSMVDGIPHEARAPKPPPPGMLDRVQDQDDMCFGYMDAVLRDPAPEELVENMPPPLRSSKTPEFFII